MVMGGAFFLLRTVLLPVLARDDDDNDGGVCNNDLTGEKAKQPHPSLTPMGGPCILQGNSGLAPCPLALPTQPPRSLLDRIILGIVPFLFGGGAILPCRLWLGDSPTGYGGRPNGDIRPLLSSNPPPRQSPSSP